MQSQLLNFFAEILQRIKARSPKLFRILQLFAGSLTFAGYLPGIFDRWFGVAMPENFINLCSDIAKYSTGFLIAAMLPVKNPEETKLPFTEKSKKMLTKKQLRDYLAEIEDYVLTLKAHIDAQAEDSEEGPGSNPPPPPPPPPAP